MAQDRADAGQIWEMSKAYMASDTVKKHDAVIDPKSVENLGTYLQKHPLETSGISAETKVDDRLQKFNIMKIAATRRLDQLENPEETYLITDEHGHDIGTYTITEDGPVFKLSPKIKEATDRVLSQFPDGEAKELLRERYEINSLEDLTNKLAKGEEIVLATEGQAQDDIKEEYQKRGLDVEGIDNSEEQEERDALNKVPSDMRDEVVRICEEQGIKIKEILVVDCPKCVGEEMTDGTNHIKENGGPVIMVQAKSGDASQLSDDLYMFQDGQSIPNAEADKDRMLDLMNEHKDEGAVAELDDTREAEIYDKIMQQVVLAEEMKKAHPEDIAKINQDLKLAVVSIINYYGRTQSHNVEDLQEDIEEHGKKEEEQAEEQETVPIPDGEDIDDDDWAPEHRGIFDGPNRPPIF